jgi:radical SAM superfamily enzyme YgiQ (UPF0313 family)
MRIALIKPYNNYRDIYFPLGLMYLAAAVRKARPGDLILIIHAKFEKLNRKTLQRKLKLFGPDVIGVTGLSSEEREMLEIAELGKELGATTILGGPHATSAPHTLLNNSNVDAICIGEGEHTLIEFLNAIDSNESVNAIPGIMTASHLKGEIEFIARNPIANLDELPFPAWDLVDAKRMMARGLTMSWYSKSKKIASILSSRGCPFQCVFCHNFLVFGRKYRARSIDNIFEELTWLKEKFGIREVEIIDDIFNFDRERTIEFCRRMISSRLGIQFQFPSGLRADRLDEETIDLLVEAGMTRVSYAFETADQNLQKSIGKNLDFAKATAMMNYTARYPVSLGGFFMLGFPGETAESAQKTAEFILSSPLQTISLCVVNAYPGTTLYNEAIRRGKIPLDDDGSISFNNWGAPKINLSEIEDEQLFKIRKDIFRKFYLDPKRLYRIFRNTPLRSFINRGVNSLGMILTGKGVPD